MAHAYVRDTHIWDIPAAGGVSTSLLGLITDRYSYTAPEGILLRKLPLLHGNKLNF